MNHNLLQLWKEIIDCSAKEAVLKLIHASELHRFIDIAVRYVPMVVEKLFKKSGEEVVPGRLYKVVCDIPIFKAFVKVFEYFPAHMRPRRLNGLTFHSQSEIFFTISDSGFQLSEINNHWRLEEIKFQLKHHPELAELLIIPE